MPNELNTFAPKYIQIREWLREMIRAGTLQAEDAVPTEFDLMRTHGVSRGTAIRALNDLATEGLIYRRQGKGTFVRSVTTGTPGAERHVNVVGVVLQRGEHLFGPMTRALIRHLQQSGLQTLVIDAFNTDQETHWLIPQIEDLLARHPEGLIIDGDSLFPFHLLKGRVRPQNLVFLHCYEATEAIPGSQVLTDDERGGYLGTRHLLELGHRRILFVPTQPWNLDCNSTGRRILKGARKALSEYGISAAETRTFERVITDHQTRDQTLENRDNLVALLSAPDRPTAVFAFGDYLMPEVYAAARLANLGIPGDLSALGYFNTPWCDMLDVPLDSMSIREEELARLAASAIVDGIRTPGQIPRRVLLAPELVRRESTAAPPPVEATRRRKPKRDASSAPCLAAAGSAVSSGIPADTED